jgi:hypothetical protein
MKTKGGVAALWRSKNLDRHRFSGDEAHGRREEAYETNLCEDPKWML